MIRSSKWIEGVHPDSAVTVVAQWALRARLETVWSYAPLAAKKSDKDIEYVHQLRVATRRARAAIQIFADLLPRRKVRWMKKTLRGLRQAAGDARDLDVLGQRLGDIARCKKDSQLSAVVDQIADCRRIAQKPLLRAYKKARRTEFKKRSRNLVGTVRWRHPEPEPAFAEAARSTLVPLVDDFLAAGGADLSDVEALHQMRIVGKQVRYAMELLSGAFDASLRGELYETFVGVQGKLGDINDHATAITMLGKWFERADYNGSRAELAELIAREEYELDAKCQAFRDWWTTERSADLARQFSGVLRNPTSHTTDAMSRRVSTSTPAQAVEPTASARAVAVAQ